MSRGKHGASAARKRAEESAEQIAALRAELAATKSAAAAESQALRTELDRVRGQLAKGIRDAASERVREAAEQAQAAEAQAEATWKRRILDGIAYVHQHGQIGLDMDGWLRFAEILGVQIGEVHAASMPDAPRETRRMTNSKARRNLTVRQWAEKNGSPL